MSKQTELIVGDPCPGCGKTHRTLENYEKCTSENVHGNGGGKTGESPWAGYKMVLDIPNVRCVSCKKVLNKTNVFDTREYNNHSGTMIVYLCPVDNLLSSFFFPNLFARYEKPQT